MKHEALDLKTNRRHPWSLGQKLRRACWILIWGLLGRPGLRAFSPLRILLLRLFGARIGEGVLVCAGVKVLMPWNLVIGNYTAIGEGVEIYNYGQDHIRKNCCVS